MSLLFVHGAGGYADDQAMVIALREALDEDVHMPDLSHEEPNHQAWSAVLTPLLADSRLVVGHSFGGSTVLKMLTEHDFGVRRLLLLAVPDWGPAGWDVPEFALPDDAASRLPPGLEIELHHCLDDDVVPFDHLHQLAARVPQAREIYRHHGGHQFEAPAINGVIRSLLGPRVVDDPGPFFHGTKADLRIGDLLVPGQESNFGSRLRANFVYVTAIVAGAGWGAELAAGDAPGRIYQVEPTGPLEDDPNVTDQRFVGNPTRSYRTRDPVRVVREVEDWDRPDPDAVREMREAMARIRERGIEAIND